MSSRRRTLCFVVSLLSLNNGLITCLPEGPVTTQYCPCPGSPPQQVNAFSPVQGPHTAFPTQRFNEVFSFGSHYPGLTINTVATTNYAAPKPAPTPFPVVSSNPLPIAETITETLPYPPNVESVTIVENYPPVPQTIQVEGPAPTANVAEIYQTPITVQIPAMPQTKPFVAVASPHPEILPSQIFTPTVVPKTPPQIIETEITTVTTTPVETKPLNIPSCNVGGQQLPITLQINIPSPSWIPEPKIAVISQPAPAPKPSSSFNPSFEMPQAPPPIIILEKSKSKLKSILPILMLSLFDGGCGNNGGGGCSCSQGSTSTPIPFPIVVPTNSPVITRGRGKGKPKAKAKAN